MKGEYHNFWTCCVACARVVPVFETVWCKGLKWKTVATTSLFCCDKELFIASCTLSLTDPIWGIPAEPSAGKEAPASSAGQQLWHPYVQERDCELLPLDYFFCFVFQSVSLCVSLSQSLSPSLSLMNTRNMHVNATSTGPGLVWLIFLLTNLSVSTVASLFACHSQRKQSMLLSVLLSVSLSILFSMHLLLVLKYVVRCSCYACIIWCQSLPVSDICDRTNLRHFFYQNSRSSMFSPLVLLFSSALSFCFLSF